MLNFYWHLLFVGFLIFLPEQSGQWPFLNRGTEQEGVEHFKKHLIQRVRAPRPNCLQNLEDMDTYVYIYNTFGYVS